MASKTSKTEMPVAIVKHKDKRVNIPTEELRDFVAEDEKAPKTILYPRDPSLDPQLVWKGKDEQDQKDLEVPAVPVYIQEKIHPQAIIEDVRAQAKERQEASQLNLFSDFNGIKFEDMVDFYHHEQNWANRMILGDSLLVMTSLAEKEGLKGKVQMIYIDPPYGIKFGSNWQVSTKRLDVKDGKAEDMSRQPEQVKAFRDTWELGIHSYLSYLRDRFVTARDLLTDTGSVFVQIGDENVHLVRCLMDEVFGSESFASEISFAKTTSFSGNYLSSICDTIIWYAKDIDRMKYRNLYREKMAGGEGASKYRPAGSLSALDTEIAGATRLARLDQLTSQGASLNTHQEFRFRDQVWTPPAGLHWKTNVDGLRRLGQSGRLAIEGRSLSYVRYLDDFAAFPQINIWLDIGGIQSRTDPKVYVVQTATEAVKRCVLMATDPGDLVLDPTCGSGTTAYVAEQWGRRWITIDTSRVALALARTRLMSARFPYFLLADSTEGQTKEAEITGQAQPGFKTNSDIKKGFVYKRVPHITLKSIANNEEIDAIHARWQDQMEPLRSKLNGLLGKNWEEWEIPREPGQNWPEAAKQALGQWWEMRRRRQKEIDDSISRRADIELLYDQPYEDNKRIRVTGPFTVESLSPHRMLSTDQDAPASEQDAQKAPEAVQFETMIIENLKKAGVQNTRKNERLKFDRLEPFAGAWLQATGEYTDLKGAVKRVAVSIGPEHGTVGPEQVKEAAKEALQGVGFDLLVVCGFAFDAHAGETAKEFAPVPPMPREGFVAEETKQFGKLPVMLARMNPDLVMGPELLKKTGSGNLFMVFGEPDVAITHTDGKVQVTIKGVDVYDPTTGQIRSNSTDDIACWFIDTNYNGESFFVRHAYFTGGNEPYDKLKRALRAEIDEEAWASLYSTTSRPFDPPKTGKIAVKVINHYGDEVLKVYEV
ncbi:MAG: site-specific DNA-methyltransferase [Chloroflexi bacterium]|nr:site-specific DNA-methyltransferase [Chloroflexota bacterium]